MSPKVLFELILLRLWDPSSWTPSPGVIWFSENGQLLTYTSPNPLLPRRHLGIRRGADLGRRPGRRVSWLGQGPHRSCVSHRGRLRILVPDSTSLDRRVRKEPMETGEESDRMESDVFINISNIIMVVTGYHCRGRALKRLSHIRVFRRKSRYVRLFSEPHTRSRIWITRETIFSPSLSMVPDWIFLSVVSEEGTLSLSISRIFRSTCPFKILVYTTLTLKRHPTGRDSFGLGQ